MNWLKTLRRQRTLILAVVAAVTFVAAAILSFGVAAQDMWHIFYLSLAVTVLMIIAAVIIVAVWKLLQKLFTSKE